MNNFDTSRLSDSEKLSTRERLVALKQNKNYSPLISQFGVDNLGIDDPGRKGRKTSKEKVFSAVERGSNQDADFDATMQSFLDSEREAIDPLQRVQLGDMVAAYDALFLREYGREQDWSSRDKQKNKLASYLESQGIDVSENAVTSRLENQVAQYETLTNGIEPSDLPARMRRVAKRIAVLEQYVLDPNQQNQEVQDELTALQEELATFPTDPEELRQMTYRLYQSFPTSLGLEPGTIFQIKWVEVGNINQASFESVYGQVVEAIRTATDITFQTESAQGPNAIIDTGLLTDTQTIFSTATGVEFSDERNPHSNQMAEDILLLSIEYLVEQGNQIKDFCTVWATDQSKQDFEKQLVAKGVVSTEEESKTFLQDFDWSSADAETQQKITQAANETWTGKAVGKLDFSTLTDFRVTENNLYLVTFSRDELLTPEYFIKLRQATDSNNLPAEKPQQLQTAIPQPIA